MEQQKEKATFENDIRQMLLSNVRIGSNQGQGWNGQSADNTFDRHPPGFGNDRHLRDGSSSEHFRGRGHRGGYQHAHPRGGMQPGGDFQQHPGSWDESRGGGRGWHGGRGGRWGGRGRGGRGRGHDHHDFSGDLREGEDLGPSPGYNGPVHTNRAPPGFGQQSAGPMHVAPQASFGEPPQHHHAHVHGHGHAHGHPDHGHRGGWRGRGGPPGGQMNGMGDGFGRNHPPPDARLWSGQPAQSYGQPRHNFSHGGSQRRQMYLDLIATSVVNDTKITPEEIAVKDDFRRKLEDALRSVQDASEVAMEMTLQNFGSLRSGFATRGSDMDLVIVGNVPSDSSAHISMRDDGLARRLEKYLLGQGIGARLLTRARVPIIKVCEQPAPELLQALVDAREKWDALPEEEKYEDPGQKKPAEKPVQSDVDASTETTDADHIKEDPVQDLIPALAETSISTVAPTDGPAGIEATPAQQQTEPAQADPNTATPNGHPRKVWLREKKKGPLDFPNDGVGIQCDINFFNPLGLHNTQMLHCYSLCDDRVHRMVLCVKAWAKRRKINSSYNGTLSSYGFVLMVLHYLVNIANPPVLPNLQLTAQRMGLPIHTIDGWQIQFWSDTAAIIEAANTGQLTRNTESVGALLAGFFQYYASPSSGRGFIWMKNVLSLRTPGGVLSKESKGWTGARTETTDKKEIRHRYLFAIEDPFELEHNVARTVTHQGIVAIRDEFRRAQRIMHDVWNEREPGDGHLMDPLLEGGEEN